MFEHRHDEESAKIFEEAELCKIWHLMGRNFHMHWESNGKN